MVGELFTTHIRDPRRDTLDYGYQELTSIWRKLRLPDYLEPLVLVVMNTGLLRGGLFNLAWADCL